MLFHKIRYVACASRQSGSLPPAVCLFYILFYNTPMSETLKRMAAEYRANAGLLLKRINELKQTLAKLDRHSGDWTRLQGRIAILESLYAESMSTARYLENYHGD